MSEFTGERVIPGQVNDDLWAEHVARYAFASRFSGRRRVLDAGCGTGYGSVEMAHSAGSVVGIDVSCEAIDYAKNHSPESNVRYLRASAALLPFSTAAFDLIAAFEVIEHLADWPDLLREARRVLTPSGLFLVSTPNRLYYADSRKLEGPNPYHVHEFEFAEFQVALREQFANVAILFQNRVEAFSFHRPPLDGSAAVRLDSSSNDPESAHFFLGVCSNQALPPLPPFVYVPRAANVLREREQHIHLLTQELAQTKQWLDQTIADHNALQKAHEQQTQHLAEQNRWALKLQQELTAAQERIVQLQDEAAAIASGYKRKVAELEQENREKTAWAIDTETRLTADLQARAKELAHTVGLLETAEQTIIERTQWAQRLDSELGQLRSKLAMIRESRWIKAGRTIGLGPRVD